MYRKTLILRIIGFLASLILTLSVYFIIVHPGFFNLGIGMAIVVIFILTVLQSMVQFIFFLDLWREKGPPWNVGVFASTISIIIIIVFFSIWIMDHLNYNMMPEMSLSSEMSLP